MLSVDRGQVVLTANDSTQIYYFSPPVNPAILVAFPFEARLFLHRIPT